MKIFIAGIIVFLIAAAYISKNECFSSHSKSNKQINYEKNKFNVYCTCIYFDVTLLGLRCSEDSFSRVMHFYGRLRRL